MVSTSIWLALPDYARVSPRQPSFAQSQPNRSPVAATIFIEAVADEVLVIDIREYSHDPDGETPRLLGLGIPVLGAVERVDDYHFLYTAPSRDPTDGFHYRIVDDSGARSEGWVFVSGRSRPARQGTMSGTGGHSIRRSTADELLTETQAKMAFEARHRAEERARHEQEEIKSKAEKATRRWEEARREAKEKARRQTEAKRKAEEDIWLQAKAEQAEEKAQRLPETKQAEEEARRLAEAKRKAELKSRRPDLSDPATWSPRYYGTK